MEDVDTATPMALCRPSGRLAQGSRKATVCLVQYPSEAAHRAHNVAADSTWPARAPHSAHRHAPRLRVSRARSPASQLSLRAPPSIPRHLSPIAHRPPGVQQTSSICASPTTTTQIKKLVPPSSAAGAVKCPKVLMQPPCTFDPLRTSLLR